MSVTKRVSGARAELLRRDGEVRLDRSIGPRQPSYDPPTHDRPSKPAR